MKEQKLMVQINGEWMECGEHPHDQESIQKAQAFHKVRKEKTRIVEREA